MAQESKAFTPEDAFAAALRADGSVVTGDDLANPATRVVIVAEFELQDEFYKAFYHDDLDRWEIFGEENFYRAAGPGDPFYDFAEQTALAFRDKLLSGPGGGRLARKLAREIADEIDREILRDLMIASGQYVQPPPVPTQIVIGPPHRKLQAKWTLEPEQELRASLEEKVVGTSRLTLR